MDIKPQDVECGSHHTLLLARSGWVYSWGSNNRGQCGVGSTNMAHIDIVVRKPRAVNVPNIVNVSCGTEHSAFIDDTGRLLTFGNN